MRVAPSGLTEEERRVGQGEVSAPRGTEQAEGTGNEVRRPDEPHQHAAGHQGAGVGNGGQREVLEAMLPGGARRNR